MVVLRGDVPTPGGDDDLLALQGEAQVGEDGAHGVLADVGAQDGVHAPGIEGDHQGVGVGGQHVDYAVHDLAAAQQLHELAGAVDRVVGHHGVQALLIAGGGFGAHVQGSGGAADGGAVEVGGLEQDHGGVADDLGVGAAHDAGQGDGFFFVADAQHTGPDGALAAVQSGEGLALAGGADDDLAALDEGEVKGVHGLAVLHHDVVGDVHQVVDGAHAHGADALAHPLGGGADLDVLDHAGGVARAQVRVLDLDVRHFGDISVAALHDGLAELQGLAEGDGGLAGQADHGQAVGAVRGDLELHHVVVLADDGSDVLAGGEAFFVQDEDAVLQAVGELLLLRVQVGKGADRVGFRVERHKVARVQVAAGSVGVDVAGAGAELAGVDAVFFLINGGHLHRDDRAVDLVSGLDVGGDGGLFGVQGVIVAQDGRRGDHGVGEVVGVQLQLAQGAQHARGGNAAQLALGDLLAAGEDGVVLRHGDEIAGMDVPCAGDDLDGLRFAHVDLADPHVVGVGMTLHRQDFADDNVLDLRAQVGGALHLGAGEGHGLGEVAVVHFVQGDVYKFSEPFSAEIHILVPP